MSALPGNPHYEDAPKRLDTGDGIIEAVLALAFEQRTANLIALDAGIAGADAVAIRERLGL